MTSTSSPRSDQRLGIAHDAIVTFVKGISQHADLFAGRRLIQDSEMPDVVTEERRRVDMSFRYS